MDVGIMTTIIGVVGTLLGTILGWLLNMFSNKGKLNIYVTYWNDSFLRINMEGFAIGQKINCSKQEEVEEYLYEVSFDLYNSSSNTKIMRDIHIVFNDGKSDVEVNTPNYDTERQSASTILYDKVEPININPKSIHKLNLTNHYGRNLAFIWNTNKVFLEYTNEKNKIIRKLIKTEDYKNYFNNHKAEDK